MTTKATGNARLLKLAEFLRTVPRKRFDYRTWVGDDWKGAQDLSCGTTACALGWATTMPEFRRLGLRLFKSSYSNTGYVGMDGEAEDTIDPSGAAEQIFGLDSTAVGYLFAPGRGESRATPKRVAKKIEKFVAARA